jgi:RNA polymerase sigma factor (sigma-70 family)
VAPKSPTTWQQCFAQASEPHWEALLRFATAQGLSPERGRDALQNALLRGLKYFSNYSARHLNITNPSEAFTAIQTNPEMSRRFRGWLFQVMRNSIYDLLSSVAKQEVHLDEATWNNYCDETADDSGAETSAPASTESTPDPSEAALEAEAEALFARASDDKLYKALQGLLPRQRQILFLIAEDNSYAEVASILGIPVGTVMSGLSRALQKVRTLLKENGG